MEWADFVEAENAVVTAKSQGEVCRLHRAFYTTKVIWSTPITRIDYELYHGVKAV